MAQTKWTLDPTHSELGFKIRHLMISNVSGHFKTFNASMETENEDFSTARISATADMSSIDTNNSQRDAHLRNSDFFEVDKYPELTFTSKAIRAIDEDNYEVTGDLTLKGITKPVTLKVEYSGIQKDPWGNERGGFTVTGKINRSDWNVNFNSLLETGGVALAEEVRIFAELQLVKEQVLEAVS